MLSWRFSLLEATTAAGRASLWAWFFKHREIRYVAAMMSAKNAAPPTAIPTMVPVDMLEWLPPLFCWLEVPVGKGAEVDDAEPVRDPLAEALRKDWYAAQPRW